MYMIVFFSHGTRMPPPHCVKASYRSEVRAKLPMAMNALVEKNKHFEVLWVTPQKAVESCKKKKKRAQFGGNIEDFSPRSLPERL